MIVGVGLDVVEVDRIATALRRHGERFERRVFTRAESAACRDRVDRVLALGARFAAKEACLKALGTGWAAGIGFVDVEVVRNPGGGPGLRLHGPAAERAAALGVDRIHVSLTHQRSVAAAVVVLERGTSARD